MVMRMLGIGIPFGFIAFINIKTCVPFKQALYCRTCPIWVLCQWRVSIPQGTLKWIFCINTFPNVNKTYQVSYYFSIIKRNTSTKNELGFLIISFAFILSNNVYDAFIFTAPNAFHNVTHKLWWKVVSCTWTS